MRTMKQTDPQFKLRLDEELKAALTAAAKENNRTLSAEIVARLTESFASPQAQAADSAKFTDEVMATLKQMQEALEAIKKRSAK